MMKEIIVFDGECGLCNWSINFIQKIDQEDKYVYLPFHSEHAESLLSDWGFFDSNGDEVLLINEDGVKGGAEAITYILLSATGFWHLIGVLLKAVPKKINNWMYRLIARNRKRFKSANCENTSCIL